VFCEILAGSLTGGGSSNPQHPTAGRLVNNMLTLAFNPAAFGPTSAFQGDVARLIDWIRSSRPVQPGGEILLPGEIESRTRADREAHGIPIDPTTVHQITEAAAGLGVRHPDDLIP
jgi:uncharacterized oxidoreductase